MDFRRATWPAPSRPSEPCGDPRRRCLLRLRPPRHSPCNACNTSARRRRRLYGTPTFRECTSRCRVAAFGSQGSGTAKRLEHAYDRNTRIVALGIPDREAILRMLDYCPNELAELRATLLQEHVSRHREGLYRPVSRRQRARRRRSSRPSGGRRQQGHARAAVDIHREDGVRPPPPIFEDFRSSSHQALLRQATLFAVRTGVDVKRDRVGRACPNAMRLPMVARRGVKHGTAHIGISRDMSESGCPAWGVTAPTLVLQARPAQAPTRRGGSSARGRRSRPPRRGRGRRGRRHARSACRAAPPATQRRRPPPVSPKSARARPTSTESKARS